MLNQDVGNQHRKAQVIEVLKQRFFPMIPTRLPNAAIMQQERERLSRSLAAFAIQKLANCSEAEAAAAVVDCGDDNGIDAIYYDRRQHILWLVQAKYGDAPDRASNQIFCSGIADLLAERYDRFHQSGHNPEFDRVQPDVEEALRAHNTSVIACVVYLGSPLAGHAIRDLDQLKTVQNEDKNWFDWCDINLLTIHGWLTAEHMVVSLNVELTLEKWNIFTIPRRAVYGLVKADQLSILYQQHGNALFAKNIRHFLGNQTVNLAIAQTVQQQPAELFFLNNGLTAICSRFDFPGSRRDRTIFTLNDFSIVNGAQTVGSIGMASQSGTVVPEAQLLITVLEVGAGEDAAELGTRITRTRNTQNAVQSFDFAALDPNQERLRQELAISGIIYHYRPSANVSSPNDHQFSLEEATRALACFSCDTRIVVTAKKEISQVYDRNGEFYPRLFRDNLSGAQLYRYVQIYRYVDGLFTTWERAERGLRQMFYRHGRYFILHIWARRNQDVLNSVEIPLSEDNKLQISRQILELAEQIYNIAQPMFAAANEGYLKIFRNMTDAEPLARAVMQQLTQPDTQTNG